MAKSEIGLESMDIEQLQGLQAITAVLIRKKTAQKNRAEGKTFARLKDIPAPKFHAHEFKKTRDIGEWFGRGKTPANYECKDCLETAYYCPTCGYVPGRPHNENYDDIGILSGSRGIKHSCGICRDELGRTVLVRS